MKHYLLNQTNKQKYFVVLCDALIVAAGILLSYGIRIYINQGRFDFDLLLDRLDVRHGLIVPLHLFTLYIFDLYNVDRLVNSVRSSIMVVLSVLLAGLITSGVFFFFPKYVFGRQVLLIHMVVLSLLLVCWRLFLFRFLSVLGRKKRIALVCTAETAASFQEQLSNINLRGIEVSHVCCKNDTCIENRGEIQYCTSVADLLSDNRFDILGYDSSREKFSNEEIRLILETKQKNKGVYELSSLYTSLTGKVPMEFVDGKWLMNSQGMQGMISKPYIRMKRLLDITMACIMLVMLLPVIVLISILIKVESKGNVIFGQERLGKNRRPFMCYKFRTMVENAEQKTGPVWSSDEDPRITKLGRILRKTRLDELPQLWNILKGDISFVGPRPIRKHFADLLSEQIPFYELRFSIQPGLSGWAQVNHDYAGSEDGQLEKFKYELFYIQNMSLFLDVFVFFKTFQSFFKLEGK